MIESTVDSVIEAIYNLPSALVYLILGFAAFLENIFPPSPGDTITVFGAVLVGTGKLNFAAVYIITTAASLGGFLFLYFIGLKVGRPYFIKKNFKFFPAELIYKGEAQFKKWGMLLLALNRFMAGVRAVVSLVAGLSKVPFWKVLVLGGVSCLIWNLGLLIGGYYLGQTIGENKEVVKETVTHFFKEYRTYFYLILGIGVLILGGIKLRGWLVERKKRKNQDATETLNETAEETTEERKE